jgi:hypothetical protein
LSGRLNTKYTFIAEQELERKRGTQRIYSLSELRGLLEIAGFTEIQGYGSLQGDQVQLAAQRLIVTATQGQHRSSE